MVIPENDIPSNLNPIDPSRMEWQEWARAFQKQMLENFFQLKAWQRKQQENNTTYDDAETDLSDHLEDTDNPHEVDKTDVSLTNVTNDAQLKRAAGDINSFDEKASPVAGDMVLLNDSEDSWATVKADVDNLPGGGGSSFTVDYEDITTDSDAVDVSGDYDLVIVRANTGSNNITIGGLTGGVDKKLVLILKTSGSNTLTVENNEATGTEKITTHTGADVSRTVGQYGGWLMFFWSGASQPWKIIHD